MTSVNRTRRTGTLAAIGLMTAAGLFLTACDEDEVAGPGNGPGSGGTSGSEGDSGSESGSGEGGSESDSGQEEGVVIPEGEGYTGALTGTLSHLAPGELMVGDQAFHIAEDTEVVGGAFCADPEVPDTDCTTDQLEQAALNGDMTVLVQIRDGVAVRVDGPGVDGPVSGWEVSATGPVSFVGEGVLEIEDRHFLVTEETRIMGSDNCGTYDIEQTDCTAEILQEVVQEGELSATATIVDGVAQRIEW
ncbi:hypothetical protein [Streptomyces marincola]|uniref:Lipoprotein n=1 Tax=Streptomyces marincola TaxID=2878388 RepID=A0A1W7D5T3_9ACTN|nr:hypothetical protein [Streptomyces marincola]ARQ71960.1 hypothetical protein CAG99_26800 [Streptomyces marincola]